MTPTQKRLRELRERQSKERQKMAELSLVDELSEEQRAELDTIEAGTPDLERQTRAAVIAAETEEREAETAADATGPDAEQRERIELRAKASLTTFLRARIEGRQVDGPEAELQKAAGIGGGIPLELWDTAETTERRDPTEAPGTVGVNLDRIRPAVFANSIAPRLGIEMPRVMSGTYASATITTSLSAGPVAKAADADAAAAAFQVTAVTPKRISARLSIQIEDIAAVGQANFESILRENLALALSDALDNEAINGTYDATTDPPDLGLVGIFARLADPAVPGAVVDFDGFAAAHAGGIDGLWANQLKEVAIVCGPATMTLAARTFQTAASYKGEMSAAAYAMNQTGGWWTNKRMPDPVSEVQQAILYRKGRSMMGGAGAMRTAVCPHWNEVSIDDIYSGSASGTRHFTMHVLLGDVILVQPDAYAPNRFPTGLDGGGLARERDRGHDNAGQPGDGARPGRRPRFPGPGSESRAGHGLPRGSTRRRPGAGPGRRPGLAPWRGRRIFDLPGRRRGGALGVDGEGTRNAGA